MNTKFIKVFDNERDASAFATVRGAKVIMRYDWDVLLDKMICEFVVEY